MASKDNRNPVAREVKAITLANTGAVEIKAAFALVASGTRNGVTYRVTRDRCTCPTRPTAVAAAATRSRRRSSALGFADSVAGPAW
ncbi:MAG: hypothetical protein HY329_11265 [Chloroflexi bacterium]|nr:hypothetical protein [Chloroflexota bacterium]